MKRSIAACWLARPEIVKRSRATASFRAVFDVLDLTTSSLIPWWFTPEEYLSRRTSHGRVSAVEASETPFSDELPLSRMPTPG